MKRRLFLIDAHGLAYRAYFALPGLSNSKGEVTNAIYGFTMMLQKLLKEESPDFIAIAFDSRVPSFRHQAYPEYKAQRARMPDDLRQQIKAIHEVVKGYRIASVELPGYEADDLMATLAKNFEDEVDEIVLVTNDKDMLQLVDDKIKVMATKKGLSERVVYDRAMVKARFGVPPERMIDLLGLTGDPSDNIPGVKKIGPKKAADLVREFGTIEEILSNLDRVKNSVDRERLSSYRDDALLGKSLVSLQTSSPVKLSLEECRLLKEDTERLRELFGRYEFKRLLKELGPLKREGVKEEIIEDREGLKGLIEELREIQSLAIDLKDGGMYLCLKDRVFFVRDKEIGQLLPILEDGSIAKFGYNLKEILGNLSTRGIALKGIGFDVMLAYFLLNPSSRNPGLEEITLRYSGEGLNQDLPGEGVVSILRLVPRLRADLKERGQLSLFEDIELKLIAVLSDMEGVGVKIDVGYLEGMSSELKSELDNLEEKIYELSGTQFNINSPKQLSHVLFEKLSLPVVKRTKTGYSTDEEVLTRLSDYNELPVRLLDYRELSKLKSTYIDALPKLVNPKTGRLHTSYSQTTTATGRLASSNPNLQNIPVRTEPGRRIRTAFIPEERDWIFLSGDYSQIELRILAHLSDDEHLREAFNEDKDIHRLTASWVFGLKEDEITLKMRNKAKVINFGIVYGMTSQGLAKELGVSIPEAQTFIDKYFQYYRGVRDYVKTLIEETQARGYVTTIWGRRRELPDINSKNRNLKEAARRIAINTPIQGSAADLIKLAMIRIHKEFKKRRLCSRMILQVHDELLFEVRQDEENLVRSIVIDGMEKDTRLKVPVKVLIKTGSNWGEMD